MSRECQHYRSVVAGQGCILAKLAQFHQLIMRGGLGDQGARTSWDRIWVAHILVCADIAIKLARIASDMNPTVDSSQWCLPMQLLVHALKLSVRDG